eukprot:CAMPEP_0184685598 /NCGR_PEP_ID=MMETSP0312-20130426/19487_1 /TAXON_ID=31354 /ORGANISM="Compsopogon coeruleus, Strain SAG 36.94" /LENGTH=280 /DNA_ID=CAMNT_0027139823 /DNA_START=271 /DNA_END=1113 /DNA_ORIENTATION=+
MSTERLHYFSEPLSSRQVSFYSDRSVSSSDREEVAPHGFNSPSECKEGNKEDLTRTESPATSAVEELLASPEAQYLTKRPGSVDQGMSELSWQMQMWTEEALRRRTAIGRRESKIEALPVSGTTNVGQSSSRSLVIKLSPMNSLSSLNGDKAPSHEPSFTSIRSSTTSFLSRVSGNETGGEEEDSEDVVDIPMRKPLRPKNEERKMQNRRESDLPCNDRICTYDATSFRSMSSDDEESSGLVGDHRTGHGSKFTNTIESVSRLAFKMARRLRLRKKVANY